VRAYVLPRQIAMHVARRLTGATLEEIGREFGHRHHTTIMHSIRKIGEMRRSDGALDCAIRRLMDAALGMRLSLSRTNLGLRCPAMEDS